MSKRNQGIMLAIIGTMFWGISSPFAQALFAQNVKPLWLVGARLLRNFAIGLGIYCD